VAEGQGACQGGNQRLADKLIALYSQRKKLKALRFLRTANGSWNSKKPLKYRETDDQLKSVAK
jgi:transcription-repair coupling factor (superfamily II helicase)